MPSYINIHMKGRITLSSDTKYRLEIIGTGQNLVWPLKLITSGMIAVPNS